MSERISQWRPKDSEDVSRERVLAEAIDRAQEVRDSGETKLYYLASAASNPSKPEVLIGARDMGKARCLLPVAQELSSLGYPLSFLVDQPAEGFITEKLKGLSELHLPSILGAIPGRRPGVVISSISGTAGPDIEFYEVATAEGFGEDGHERAPTIWVEDFWGVASQERVVDSKVAPDVICCFDETSREMNLARFREAGMMSVTRDTCIVTGSPAFDEIAHEDREGISTRVRERLGIKDDELLLSYIGFPPPADLENLEIMIKSLNQAELGGKKIKVAARIHPSIFLDGPLGQYREAYEKLLSNMTQTESVETMGTFTTDEVTIASDIVVSAFSTEGIKAVYRGKISLFMLLQGLGGDILRQSVGMDTLPVIETDASIGIFEVEDMKAAIERSLDPEIQNQISRVQAERYTLDGGSTRRVVDLVERMLAAKDEIEP